MIDVDYNEYKETLAENMKLIKENHDLKERLGICESDSDTVIMSKEKWEETKQEIERLNNIINRTTKYVQSLSSKGRGCDIYEDIKQEILKELKGSDKK